MSDDLLGRTSEYHAEGQEDYARGLVHRAIQQDPNNTEAWSMAMELARSERERKNYQQKMWDAMEGKATDGGPFPFAPLPPDTPGPVATPFSVSPATPLEGHPPVVITHSHIPPDPFKRYKALFTNKPLEAETSRSYIYAAILALVAAYMLPGVGLAFVVYWLWQARQVKDAGVQTQYVGCLWAVAAFQIVGFCFVVTLIFSSVFSG